jgi:hypothetical protein
VCGHLEGRGPPARPSASAWARFRTRAALTEAAQVSRETASGPIVLVADRPPPNRRPFAGHHRTTTVQSTRSEGRLGEIQPHQNLLALLLRRLPAAGPRSDYVCGMPSSVRVSATRLDRASPAPRSPQLDLNYAAVRLRRGLEERRVPWVGPRWRRSPLANGGAAVGQGEIASPTVVGDSALGSIAAPSPQGCLRPVVGESGPGRQ